MQSDAGVVTSGDDEAPTTRLSDVAAAGLLGGGVGVGVASLFPSYLGASSLTAQAVDLVVHVIPLVGWAIALVVIVAWPFRGRSVAGALGLGIASVGLGLIIVDIGTATSGGPLEHAGAGLALGVIEWVLATAGSVAALLPYIQRRQRVARALGPQARLGVALVALASLAAAILIAPSWDRYVIDLRALGRVSVVTAGNVFANPGAVIAGNVITMLGIVTVGVVAARVASRRVALALVLGVLVELLAQIVSALVQWREPLSPTFFGLSPATAQAAGFQASNGFTWMFYGFCVAAFVLLVACLLRFLAPERERQLAVAPGPAPVAAPSPGPLERRAFSPTPHY